MQLLLKMDSGLVLPVENEAELDSLLLEVPQNFEKQDKENEEQLWFANLVLKLKFWIR